VSEQQLESWHSASYAAEWAGEDVVADLLLLPRRISAAIVDAGVAPEHVIDLGSGPGAYLEVFLQAFPQARGTWTDSSEAMRELGEQGLAAFGDRVAYEIVDVERLADATLEPADVVVTSRVLHHFSSETLQQVYRAVFDVLRPGGFFFNLDHIGPPAEWEQVYRRIRDQFTGGRKRALAPHRQDHPFPKVSDQLAWAEAVGFETPDTPWRTFYTALIAARKPV
jgi:SAM-dependent methyltransferase